MRKLRFNLNVVAINKKLAHSVELGDGCIDSAKVLELSGRIGDDSELRRLPT